MKASIHTEWDWEPDNITFRNLREAYIKEEIEKYYKPGVRSGAGRRPWLRCNKFLGKCI